MILGELSASLVFLVVNIHAFEYETVSFVAEALDGIQS